MNNPSTEEIRQMIEVDDSRDNRLTDFGKRTLKDRYCLPGESYQDVFARASVAFCGGDMDLAQRLYDYASKLWFCYATPLIANGGTNRGLPISCFLNYVHDSIDGLAENFRENAFLATNGGGIGSYWGHVRSVGERTSRGVETPGAIPFMHCIDSQMLAYHQGSTRRGAAAIYMDMSHPEIYEFIGMRSSTGGDVHRKNENLHHGVCISDAFMQAVVGDESWELVDPNSGNLRRTVMARDLWIRLLQTRVQLGEPYLFFVDTANRHLPRAQQRLGLRIHHSNLCTEITLPTSVDRTAVCCLSSVNLARNDEWDMQMSTFISDLVTMLDNALEVFMEQAPGEMWRAVNSVRRERSIGLGTMGLHTALQQLGLSVGSQEARDFNNSVFRAIKHHAVDATKRLARERGEPSDLIGTGRRNAHLLSVAPNASSSIICGGVSPSIEPLAANSFAQKTQSGTHEVRNPALAPVLMRHGRNDADTWSSITTNRGSVQHLDFLSEDERALFRTAIELDQSELVHMAADRQRYICQSQSLNLFFPASVSPRELHDIHLQAWQSGLKALYYLRSESVRPAEAVSHKVERRVRPEAECNDDICTVCEG